MRFVAKAPSPSAGRVAPPSSRARVVMQLRYSVQLARRIAVKPNPLARLTAGPRQEIAPGVHLLPGFGNTTFIVGDDGVAVVDPGLFTNGPRVVRELRALTDRPVRYVIYTHGHYDHAFGTP